MRILTLFESSITKQMDEKFVSLYGLAIGFTMLLCSLSLTAQTPIRLKWLGNIAPKTTTGVSWGVPFGQGEIKSTDNLVLKDAQGNRLPLQAWNMAYWPDKSIKWAGLASVVPPNLNELLLATDGNRAKDASDLASDEQDEIVIDTGPLQCVIPKQGKKLLSSLIVEGAAISTGGELICITQDGPETDFGEQPDKQKFIGQIEKVTLESNGAVRSVVRIQGQHVNATESRTWLPFDVRLYFYKGLKRVRLVHTLVFDGEQQTDFVRGIGLAFDLPMEEELYNRHVRFSGDQGRFWDEPVQPLTGRRRFAESNGNGFQEQLQGKRMPPRDSLSEHQRFLVDNWASWNDFKLVQGNSHGFRISKRTNEQSVWLDAGAGQRSTGMVFAGGVSGGLAVGLRDFWQSYPSAMELRGMRRDTARLKVWLWSPDNPAMDMRHYDTIPWGHNLEASYEDVQPGHSTPYGVARTSELTLFAHTAVPDFDTLQAWTEQADDPPLLMATPEYVHQAEVFGIYSLPDRSTKGKVWLEDQLDNAFDYYKGEVDKRDWFGFWHYGDIMHAYDPDRHTWRYDIGGYAWDNTELMPNLWLWYHFLRTGKKDAFRMAEAMTRHTGEVDVYHKGPFKGLGSRHNVIHWGDGSKEVRISQAALGRIYYYLSTDERVGDLMEAAVEDSNEAIAKLDPLRLILEPSDYPTHARVGPDWFALVGNWMTAWERTGSKEYRDRILTGVNSFSKMPFGFYSGKGGAFGYNPETYTLHQLYKEAIGYSHLSVLMGGPEIAFELSPLLDNKKWDRLWLQFCRLFGAGSDAVQQEFGVASDLGRSEPWYARLPAYYAYKTGDKAYAERAWQYFLDERFPTNFDSESFDGPQALQPLDEIERVSTNNTAQWCLNAIELLEMVGDEMPEEHPRYEK